MKTTCTWPSFVTCLKKPVKSGHFCARHNRLNVQIKKKSEAFFGKGFVLLGSGAD